MKKIFPFFILKIKTFSLKIFDKLIRIIFICIFHFKFAEVPGLPWENVGKIQFTVWKILNLSENVTQRKWWKAKKIETIELNHRYEYENVQRMVDVKFPYINISIEMTTPGINPMKRTNSITPPYILTAIFDTAQCYDVSTRRMHPRPLQSLNELHFVIDVFVSVILGRQLWT